MPPDLPGFYFDAEKNRYFPLKRPRPRADSSHASAAASKRIQPSYKNNISGKRRIQNSKLLQLRELHGKVLSFSKWKTEFQQEYQKLQASQPAVWRYDTGSITYSALEEFNALTQTPQGQMETTVLLAGSMNSSISLFEVGKVGQVDYGVTCVPKCVWPLIPEYRECSREPTCITSLNELSTTLSSSISHIKRIGGNPSYTGGDASSFHQHGLVTTLGSGTSGGTVNILNLNQPLDAYQSNPFPSRQLFQLALLNCTIWTADCNSSGTKAVIGTNQGAALINLESGALSWVCRSESDILCQQLDQSGHNILCGFRNGVIVTVDVRQKQRGSFMHSTRLPKQIIPYSCDKIQKHSSRQGQHFTKQSFKLKGNVNPSDAIYMPSAICSLVLLQSDDQYFLASSMDGSIKLYDRRLVQRGAVQSYEGHVNSHSRLQLGMDSSEKLIISGGEDGSVRIWNIKTAELLFGSCIADSVISTVCWLRTGMLVGSRGERQFYDKSLYEQNHSWGAWMGSGDGLFYVHGS